MNRYEFIERLRAALAGKATQSSINENIRYYEEYLDTEIRKGRSEEEVLRSLGDPRLLAKSIVEANRQAGNAPGYGEAYQDTIDYDENGKKMSTSFYIKGNEYRIPKWALIVMLVLAAFLVIVLVGVVLRVLLPIVIPIVLISIALKIVAVLIRQ